MLHHRPPTDLSCSGAVRETGKEYSKWQNGKLFFVLW